MLNAIPTLHAHFAQLAVQQRFISPEQVRSAVELFRRYEAAGGDDVPSLSRILVSRKLLSMQKAELLLRHLIHGEPLPPPQTAAKPAPALDELDVIEPDLGLEPPGSAIDLPVNSNSGANASALDERQALIEGLGATVMRKELKNIKGYKITQVIGEGSMGIVYKAHQISMDRTVALKVLPAERTKDRRFVDEFLAEARNAGRLNHPNLIRVHEVGEREGTYYYSMEYVEGQRLDEWMDECEDGRLPAKDALNVFAQVAAALDYGFRCGVIHREIRPNTIMVSDDAQAKLADLGLTKDEHTRFLDGENAYYVAPEQIKTRDVDTRADIYSLGCCLFHCLTGEPPFEGGGPKDVLQRRLTAPAPNAQELNPEIPAELAGIIIKMMAREPRDRYQTPAEVADALKKVNLAPPTRGVKPMTPKYAKRPLRPGLRRPGQRPTSGRLGAKGRYGAKRRYR
ncbi:MAG TPA: serine/threonine-protein kinase [Planctomycetota bacterium]|nr:serine/threonine-protein kinase [Planctomycetota bacterium]